ncbi:3-hydroxyacyl-ACP dehydratase FabZ family protein [Streptomyces sp. NPDC090082]|uniref:3-hydroxyacyl-ACP dehydratase FabZ family protein n=1 Tax=unclassified Streptomyces TaxID=2593676 RepID=UPI0037F39482
MTGRPDRGPDVHPDPADLLPYGHPALHVDRILDHRPGALTAVKAVSGHELGGHAGSARPARLPSTLVLESFLQACGLLAALDAGDGGPGRLLVFGSARNLCFEGAVRAGELLVHEVERGDTDGDTTVFSGVSRTGDGRLVLTVERAITLSRPADALAPAGSGD